MAHLHFLKGSKRSRVSGEEISGRYGVGEGPELPTPTAVQCTAVYVNLTPSQWGAVP